MNLTVLTEPQVDALWAPLAAETNDLFIAILGARAAIRLAEHDPEFNALRFDRFKLARIEREADSAREVLPELEKRHEAAELAEAPFRAEWDRRSGWTRAYLVITNGQGHVHRSTHCGTCFPTTRFEWLIDWSGRTEQEIVDDAGERACTVCYASAPVELRLDRATKLFGADEIRKQADRVEREQKRAKADAEKIVVEGVSDIGDRPRTHTFKTVRAATNFIAGELTNLTWYGTEHPSANRWIANVANIREALAAKGVDYDYDKALATARKRAVREGRDAARY